MSKAKKKSNKKNKRSFKVTISFFVVIILLAGFFVVMRYLMPVENSSYILTKKDDKVTVMAHRGLSAMAPENTIPAFEAAGIAGYSSVELDVHTTKDGLWCVMHDGEVDRMTDGTGNISDYTLEQLKELNIDSGNNCPAYENLTIPAVDEVLNVCFVYGMKAYIEIKECDEELIGDLIDKVKSYDIDAEYISFNMDYLDRVRELDDDNAVKLLVSIITDDVIKSCKEKGYGISFNHKNFENLFKLRQLKKEGIDFVAWTVDSVIMADICYLFGVKTITTNRLLP